MALAPPSRPQRLGAFFPLRVREEGERLHIFVPKGLYIKRGLLLVFAIPPLLLVLAALLFAILEGEPGETVELVFTVAWGIGSAAFALWGLVLIMASSVLVRRHETVVDRRAREVTCKGGKLTVPLDGLATVAVFRDAGLSGWLRIAMVGASGEQLVVLHDRIGSGYERDAAWVAKTCCSFLKLPSTVPVGSMASPLGNPSRDQAAALCYLPLQGVFLIASVYYLVSARDRPMLRFAAIQSLAQFFFSILVLLVILIAGGVPVALLDDGTPRWIAVGALSVLLVGFFVWNLTTRIVATTRAYRGKLWVMPWLAPVVRRWLPPEAG